MNTRGFAKLYVARRRQQLLTEISASFILFQCFGPSFAIERRAELSTDLIGSHLFYSTHSQSYSRKSPDISTS
jgi:hypothetical protein